jgi:hypothetical protein
LLLDGAPVDTPAPARSRGLISIGIGRDGAAQASLLLFALLIPDASR